MPSQLEFLEARAIFEGGQTAIACQIRLSITGARVLTGQGVTLPDEFLLDIPAHNKTYQAGLRWRSRDAAGVRFLREVPRAAAEPAGPQDALAMLQAENEALRQQNRELVEQLARVGLRAGSGDAGLAPLN